MIQNALEDSEILSPEILAAIDILLRNAGEGVVFGGSIALNAVGLIRRPIKDIDVMVHEGQSIGGFNLTQFVQATEEVKDISETTTDVNGDIITRVGAKINDVRICIFKLPVLTFSQFKFSGRMIKIQNVNEAIIAKRAYSKFEYKSQVKHIQDVEEADEFLKQII
jgi:hypothetical protein